MDNKKIRAAIYARVSTAEQNPEMQLNELREYVKLRGFVLYKEYVDTVSGDFEKRKNKRKRKDQAYQELMDDAQKRLIDCVIVWKYDRFARSLSVLIESLERFNRVGVDFISYKQNIDTTTAMGRLFYNVIGSFSEFEREMIVERVNAGLANARAKGIRLGRPEKDPSAGGRISALREEGWSLRQIAKRESLSPAGVLKILRRIENNVREADMTVDSAPAAMNLSQRTKILDALMLAPLANQSAEPIEKPSEIYQFHIVICGVTPYIWRQVQVSSDTTLDVFSDIIQKLFDWGGYHLHKFEMPGPFGLRGAELDVDESTLTLAELNWKPGDVLSYEYDFGDSWLHEIVFEKSVPAKKRGKYPICMAGKNAPPPEDCGGPESYMFARGALKRQKGKKRRSRLPRHEREFYNENYPDFNPDKFDKAAINKALSELRQRSE